MPSIKLQSYVQESASTGQSESQRALPGHSYPCTSGGSSPRHEQFARAKTPSDHASYMHARARQHVPSGNQSNHCQIICYFICQCWCALCKVAASNGLRVGATAKYLILELFVVGRRKALRCHDDGMLGGEGLKQLIHAAVGAAGTTCNC